MRRISSRAAAGPRHVGNGAKVAHDSAAQLPAGMRNEVSDPGFIQPLEHLVASAEKRPMFWRKPLEGLIGNFLLCAEAGREL